MEMEALDPHVRSEITNKKTSWIWLGSKLRTDTCNMALPQPACQQQAALGGMETDASEKRKSAPARARAHQKYSWIWSCV